MSVARLMQMAAAGAGGGVPWDISTATYLQSFSVAAQEAVPSGLFFKPDGLKMYVTGSSGTQSGAVHEYNLSAAWDVSTASFLHTLSVVSQEGFPTDISFKPDGLKMYILGSVGDDVDEYNLSTAWDISTATYLQSFSVAAQETVPQGLFFKPDGLKMYVVGSIGDAVNEYNLSTAWNISTASFIQSLSVSAQDAIPSGLFFKPDGLKMYVLGASGDAVYEYDLILAWDVSTASYLQNFSVADEDIAPVGVFFKPDGSEMYIMGNIADAVHQYSL